MSRLRIAMAMAALMVWAWNIVEFANTYQVPILVFYLTWCSGFLLGSWKETEFINK